MAFGSGRSNSLSINTGSGSLFGNNQSNTTQAQQTPSLFGASTPQPQQSGGLFGNTQSQQSGSLFGNTTNTSQAQQSTSLFGATATAQPQQSGGLFGATATAQPQQSSSLFGNTNNATTAPAAGGSLFGASTQQSQQPQQSGGLFGNLGQTQNQNQTQSSGLFGNMGQNNNNNNNNNQNNNQGQQSGGGLFGGLSTQNKPAAPSLFGGSLGQQPNNNAQQSSLFGSSFINPSGSTSMPLAGSLTMGQGNNAQATVPGTKIDISNLRPTTRFGDLHDELKKQIEAIDTFIRQQESYCAQCEALIPMHASNVDSIKPDVDLITGKNDTVELALENDSREIETAKTLVRRDAEDLMRCARVMQNLSLPSQFHYPNSAVNVVRPRPSSIAAEDGSVPEMDIVGYVSKQAETMQSTLNTFTSHLSEIETHLRVIEASTVHQAQQLAAQRAGGRQGRGQDTVRELADTLRGFETGILGAAGVVGACREGVNELILGRIGGDAGDGSRYNGRRTTRY